MKKINVVMIYTSEDPPGFEEPFHYRMIKTFNFPELPPVPCTIRLQDDAIESFTFNKLEYDPNDNSYTVKNITYEGVHRYYHGDAEEIMKKVVKRYEDHGWSCQKIMEKIYTE